MRVETTTTPEEAIGHLRRAAAEGDPVEVALVDRQTVGEQADAFARRMRSDPAIAGTGLLIATNSAVAADAEFLVVTFKPIGSGGVAELRISSMVLQGAAGSAVVHEPVAAFRTSITQ